MTLAREYPVSLICQALDLARSSYYYDAQDQEDPSLTQALVQVAETWPTYGYRRMTAQLRREGWAVNSKRVRHLMHTLGLQCKIELTKRKTTDSDHPFPRYPNRVKDLQIIRPEQVWVADSHMCVCRPSCLPSRDHGCVHSLYLRLAFGAQSGQ